MATSKAVKLLEVVMLALLLAPAVSDAQMRPGPSPGHRPGPGHGPGPRPRSVPEFDPAAIGVVAALVAGGGLLVARRRRR